jgi:hypothetical protein
MILPTNGLQSMYLLPVARARKITEGLAKRSGG